VSVFDAVRDISARDAAERAGLDVRLRGGKAWTLCPLHGEKTPSLRLYDEPERGWYCFGCCKGGDAVRLYAELYRLEPLDAARALADAFGFAYQEGAPPVAQPTVWNLRRGLEAFRTQRISEVREVYSLASWVARGRAALNRGDAWKEPNFIQAVEAMGAAIIEIEQLGGATLEDLAEGWAAK